MEDIKSSRSTEEIAAGLLDDDKLKAFLAFYDFLNKNKIKKTQSGRKPNDKKWSFKYKSKTIGSVAFDGGSWSIRYFNLIEKCEEYLTAELKDFILANINTTSACCVKGMCHSAENKIIYGKLFANRVCSCWPVMLIDPDGKTLEYAKELVLSGKNMIAETAVNGTK